MAVLTSLHDLDHTKTKFMINFCNEISLEDFRIDQKVLTTTIPSIIGNILTPLKNSGGKEMGGG